MKILSSQVILILVSFTVSGIHAQVCTGDLKKCTCTEADCTDIAGNKVVPANPECTEFYICSIATAGIPGNYIYGPESCADGELLGVSGCQPSLAGCDFLNDNGVACPDPGPPTVTPVCNYICNTGGCPTTPYLIASNKGCQYYFDCCANTEEECPTGSVFNGDVCVPSGGEFPTCCDEMCSVTMTCVIISGSTAIYDIPDENDCRKFIVCDPTTGNQLTTGSCSEGEVFDAFTTKCIAGSDCMTYCELSNSYVTTTTSTTTASSTTSTSTITSIPTTTTTSTSSPITTASTHTTSTPTTSTTSTTTITGPPPVGPDDCYLEIICDRDYVPRCPNKCDETYYVCTTGDPIERQCPPGYTFDPTIYTCVITCTIN